jgi:hypothetical protein
MSLNMSESAWATKVIQDFHTDTRAKPWKYMLGEDFRATHEDKIDMIDYSAYEDLKILDEDGGVDERGRKPEPPPQPTRTKGNIKP